MTSGWPTYDGKYFWFKGKKYVKPQKPELKTEDKDTSLDDEINRLWMSMGAIP